MDVSSSEVALLRAVKKGDSYVVYKLINAGVLKCISDACQERALFAAVAGGRVDIASALVRFGRKVLSSESFCSPLDAAIGLGESRIVYSMLALSYPIHGSLSFAAHYGNIEMVRLLLTYGGNPNESSRIWRDTPLHRAAFIGSEDICRILLYKGADVTLLGDLRQTPLHLAAEEGHEAVVALLIARRAPFQDERWLVTPLHSATLRGHLNVVQLLLQSQFPANVKNVWGETAMDVALDNGFINVARTLNSYGARPQKELLVNNAVTKGRSLSLLCALALGAELTAEKATRLLFQACVAKSPDIVRILLQKGASVLYWDELGNTALHLACKHNCSERIIKMLLDKGALIDKVNKGMQPPIHLTSSTSLQKFLIREGADVNMTDETGKTLLHKATSIDLVTLLLERNALVDARDMMQGKTPLHEAVEQGNLQKVRLLLDHGASVDAYMVRCFSRSGMPVPVSTNNGVAPIATALLLACELGHEDITRLLLDHKASLDVDDYMNETPLHKAVQGNHVQITELLIKAGCNVNVRNWANQTPLDQAKSENIKQLFMM